MINGLIFIIRQRMSTPLDFNSTQRRSLNRGRTPIRSTASNTRNQHAHINSTKRQMTPILAKIYGLKKALEMYTGTGITKELREIWAREMSEMDQIQYVNMDHLAIALIMIHKSGQQGLIPARFDESKDSDMAQYLDRLRLNSRTNDKSTIRGHKEVILSYIFMILIFRRRNEGPHQQVQTTIVDEIQEPDDQEVQPPNIPHVTGTEDDYLPE
jgi:hypothetical protein